MRRIINTRAFSLMETVIAAVVFSVAVAGVMVSLSSVSRPTQDLDKSFYAARCAQQVLESLRARDYTSPALDPAGSPYTLTAAQLAGFSACTQLPITSFTYQVEDAGSGGARKVTARVDW